MKAFDVPHSREANTETLKEVIMRRGSGTSVKIS
jgi:hypothetical protein